MNGWAMTPRGGRRRLPLIILALVLVVAVALAVALNWPRDSGWFPGSPPPVGNTLMPSSSDDIARARTSLGQLTLLDRTVAAQGYRRAAFGAAWQDIDGNGCNQRDDVLLRDVVKTESFTVGRQQQCDHDMLSGTWVDPYTGTSVTLTDAKQQSQAESVQIDHIVPLSVAWRYGAAAWTDDQRLRFANDLDDLAAVGGASNQAKGGSDPSQWRPIRAAQCGYAVRYTLVKAKYSLSSETSEKEALRGMLATCP